MNGLSGSVGYLGRNHPEDVRAVQTLLRRNGNHQLTVDGICGERTISAISHFQSTFIKVPDKRIDPQGITWRRLSSVVARVIPRTPVAPPAPVRAPAPVHTPRNRPASNNGGSLTVTRGQVTFDAEGSDSSQSPYFSRVIHWPGNSLSGVTLGRGYDMGNRSEESIYSDMVGAGLDVTQARKMSKAAGLKGNLARDFVRSKKNELGEITHKQQVALFELIYPDYMRRAKSNYDAWTSREPGRTAWEQLKPVIQDMMVDFVYQGFTKGASPMKAGMKNDIDELIRYIENTQAIKQYEAGRNRANYLKKNK